MPPPAKGRGFEGLAKRLMPGSEMPLNNGGGALDFDKLDELIDPVNSYGLRAMDWSLPPLIDGRALLDGGVDLGSGLAKGDRRSALLILRITDSGVWRSCFMLVSTAQSGCQADCEFTIKLNRFLTPTSAYLVRCIGESLEEQTSHRRRSDVLPKLVLASVDSPELE